jgi:hypothetical protein
MYFNQISSVTHAYQCMSFGTVYLLNEKSSILVQGVETGWMRLLRIARQSLFNRDIEGTKVAFKLVMLPSYFI